MFKHPVRRRTRFQGYREAITLSTSWFDGAVPSGGDASSFLRERCENWCPSVSKGCATRFVKPLNADFFSGQKWVFQQDSAPAHKVKTTQEWLRRHIPTFISTENWPSGSPDLNHRTINCGLFWRTWLVKSVTTTWTV